MFRRPATRGEHVRPLDMLGGREASAQARAIATTFFDQYLAFCREGFTRAEALELVKHMMQVANEHNDEGGE